jgi:hypothetical protein
MPDTPETQPEPSTALVFLPVPRLKHRSNGWSPEVQQAFIDALAETGSVREACRRVRRSDNGAYQLRRHPEGATFRAAWDAALDLAIRRIEDGAMDRALYGTEERIYYHGELVGTRHRYNERLVMFMLRNRAPERFATGGGARGLNAIDRMQRERERKQWRAEWDRERAEAQAATEARVEDFVDQIEGMHRRWYAALSPRARAAYRHFRRLERADFGHEWMLDEAEAEAEYAAEFTGDRRSKAIKLGEVAAIGVNDLLVSPEAQADPPLDPETAGPEPDEGPAHPEPVEGEPVEEAHKGPRIRSLKGDWH